MKMKLFKGNIEWLPDYYLETFGKHFTVKDINNCIIYYESIDNYWYEQQFNEKNECIYRIDNQGVVFDNRIKKMTIEEIEKMLGFEIEIIK